MKWHQGARIQKKAIAGSDTSAQGDPKKKALVSKKERRVLPVEIPKEEAEMVPFSYEWLDEYHKRKRSGFVKGITANRDVVSKRLIDQNSQCPWCGDYMSIISVSIEHIIPLSLGGDSRMANLAVAHRICNARRGSNIDQDVAPGEHFDFIRQKIAEFRRGDERSE